jgi:hypothetical protein
MARFSRMEDNHRFLPFRKIGPTTLLWTVHRLTSSLSLFDGSLFSPNSMFKSLCGRRYLEFRDVVTRGAVADAIEQTLFEDESEGIVLVLHEVALGHQNEMDSFPSESDFDSNFHSIHVKGRCVPMEYEQPNADLKLFGDHLDESVRVPRAMTIVESAADPRDGTDKRTFPLHLVFERAQACPRYIIPLTSRAGEIQ